MSPPAAGAERLAGYIARFADQHVVVVGDVMLDHFVFGRVNRISPEAPVPVVEFDHEQFRLGGAANVSHNLRALRSRTTLVGIVGEDDAAERVLAALGEQGIGSDGLVRTTARPTTRKMRIVTTRNQQVARIDYENDEDLAGSLEREVMERAVGAISSASIVIVSDYLKGVVTSRLMRAILAAAASRRVPVLVDPKIPHIDHYEGATVITPNHHEAEVATAMRIRTDEDARAAARAFRERAQCTSVVITRGEHGMWVLDRGTGAAGDVREIPAAGRDASSESTAGLREVALDAIAREVADVTGAGDTTIATLATAIAAGAALIDAATLATHAAAVSVSKFGPSTVTPEELREALGASA